MVEINVESVGMIIEGALEGDIRKVKAYAIMIAGNLEYDGEEDAAKVIKDRLDGGEL
ncbi:hypothetical protein KPL40_03780 [Clostridium gasigenes]|uniref:hypothetical protein n=1 Tax=Clostridium gasigenes TaxID=94869 RepID=UPI001C0D9C55|nr:hypothetical protein [Clostridium gasigenes]MBU3131561.1 hypothetical protein [Clostridium gasigenes]